MDQKTMDQEAIDMANGVKHAPSAGCLHVTLGGSPAEDDCTAVPFADFEIEPAKKIPLRWDDKLKRIVCLTAAMAAVSVISFVGIQTGNVTVSFGQPIIWGASLVAAFSIGTICRRRS